MFVLGNKVSLRFSGFTELRLFAKTFEICMKPKALRQSHVLIR